MRPVSRLESSVASLTRCASPPESVVALWPEVDVAEPDVVQRDELVVDARLVLEERHRVLHRELEHVGDAHPAELHVERLAVVALAAALLAGDVDVGEEVHLDLHESVALAGLAAAALHVEGEAARAVAAELRLRHLGEELADGGEEAGVGRRVRARRASDRRLVDVDHLVEVLEARRCGRARRGSRGRGRSAARGRAAGCPRRAWTCPTPRRR